MIRVVGLAARIALETPVRVPVVGVKPGFPKSQGPATRWVEASPGLTANRRSDIVAAMTTILDLSGLKCPLPALKTRKALGGIAPGERLEVHCTDPLAVIDIPNLVSEMGHRLAQSERNGERSLFVIEKCVPPET